MPPKSAPRSASPAIERAKRNAEARFHELVEEFRQLTMAFPHLREAADPEDLPISFLLKRGADRAATRMPPAAKAVARTTKGMASNRRTKK